MDIITPEQMQVFGQLILAVLLGSLIGLERTLAHRMAGFKTFAMVSLGACAFTVIGKFILETFAGRMGMSSDPTHLSLPIITGVGFLAGGLIVFHKDHVEGLTTGTGLWVSAAIGLAVGMQLYAIAVFITLLVLIIFGLFWKFEQKIVEHEKHIR